jgi:hypothetical protein
MKKTLWIIGVLFSITAVVSFVWVYGEGPSQHGRWIEGRVAYSDGSKCGKCCSISIETENGFSKEGCTDDNGNYKIYVSSDYVKAVYFRGSKIWSGSQETKGGATVNILAK